MNWTNFRRFAQRLVCVLGQVAMIGLTAGLAAYTACHTDHGKLLAHELAKGAAGGMVVGLFLALNKLGTAA